MPVCPQIGMRPGVEACPLAARQSVFELRACNRPFWRNLTCNRIVIVINKFHVKIPLYVRPDRNAVDIRLFHLHSVNIRLLIFITVN